jgi:hypothetical protein
MIMQVDELIRTHGSLNIYIRLFDREKFKEDYEAVDKLLNDLPHKTTHDVMVSVLGKMFIKTHSKHPGFIDI